MLQSWLNTNIFVQDEKDLGRVLSMRQSRFNAYSDIVPADSAHTQCTPQQSWCILSIFWEGYFDYFEYFLGRLRRGLSIRRNYWGVHWVCAEAAVRALSTRRIRWGVHCTLATVLSIIIVEKGYIICVYTQSTLLSGLWNDIYSIIIIHQKITYYFTM